QQIIIFGFLIFLIFTSNPFSEVFPIPKEGLGLNPILQDPILAIHPPVLYIGYVSTSIIFSSSLSSIILGNVNSSWAGHIKKWIIGTWIFLTGGILLGSIWAYYELGWGGFWFWDPVENISLMPWISLTALLHCILVLNKRSALGSWSIILSITTFTLSICGTFLVRSGILNSVHTFANDPERGLYILLFLFFIIFMSLIIYFFYEEKLNFSNKSFGLITKESHILINNWFLMYFLSVILIGTVYPIFLEVIANQKISVGPPFFNKLIIPFLIPFLIFMSIGPNLAWIKSKKFEKKFILFLFLIINLILSYLILNLIGKTQLTSILLLAASFYLFFISFKDLLKQKRIEKKLIV
ncbi:cytochrome c biogenesis protein CcsA, partial [Pelagibacterales bacterium SAG-MED14]|nr:cytochrome c biogenesis protein CcsA [Pelagibacterales bacterium SAG-MED14]